MALNNLYVFDCEVFAYDWLFVFKEVETGNYEIIHNDNEAIQEFMRQQPLICGFNNKHYDNHILKGCLLDFIPEDIKQINDAIIVNGMEGWDIPQLRDSGIYFESFDLMDDMQVGLSLKAIEAHLGMNIEETEVDFNINRPLTAEELELTIQYCKFDVDATHELLKLRKNYLNNKLMLGRLKGIEDSKALYMTNAKLTALYLDAKKPEKEYTDEREYVYPANLKREYIPNEVFAFFDKLKDKTIPDEEIFSSKLEFNIGECEVTIAYGGIHGAIPTYREQATDTRSIRNQDVASYYPHLMTIDKYCSRNIPNPQIYEDMLEKRMQAKKSGDKATANALKLVANTTYGGTLNQYNELYDPLMARSVCITGQLRLLEMTNNLVEHCPSVKVIQLNTDGIMISIDNVDLPKYEETTKEWQERTKFELEEDCIKEIVQKDVNNYIEIALDGSTKIKGGQLVRGIAPAGAFNINNNATIVAKAILNYFAKNEQIEDTINNCNDPLEFMLIAKASSKYSGVYQVTEKGNIDVQRCNRVYASLDRKLGTLYKIHKEKGTPAKIAGLPEHCLIVNDNCKELDVERFVDKKWYIKLAHKYVDDFLGIKPIKINKRKINSLSKEIDKIIDAM